MEIFKRLLISSLIVSAFCLTSCDSSSPVFDKIGEALNREPEQNPELGGGKTPQELADTPAPKDIPPPPEPVPMEKLINKEARVSVLGYHDFTEDERPRNDMIINVEDFRAQMQAIKDAELPVISMREFLDWKAGKSPIPDRCVLITIDDGWKATNTLGMGVLKEFEYPFTVFLYKKYVGVGGRSLTHDEIREIISNGGTIGSHSVSHDNMAAKKGRSTKDYEAWLKVELEDSYQFLVDNFGDTGGVIKTFAFPYGVYSDRILELAKEYGYEACFTVNGKKTPWDAADMEIGRYIVHGTTLANFDPALSFGGGNVTSSGRKLISETKSEDGVVQGPLVTMYPPKDTAITNRLPRIEMDLSKLKGIDSSDISMRITGFGKVPHVFESETGLLSYQIPQRIRGETVGVQVSFKHSQSTDYEKIGWNFKIDQVASYLSDTTEIVTERQVEAPSDPVPAPTEEETVEDPTTAAN